MNIRKILFVLLGITGLCLLILNIGIMLTLAHRGVHGPVYGILPPVLLVPWIIGLGGIFALSIKSYLRDHQDIYAILLVSAIFPIVGISTHDVHTGHAVFTDWFMMSWSISASFSMMRAWICITPSPPFKCSV